MIDWPEIPRGCVVFMMSSGPPKSAKLRAREARQRRKLGFELFRVDLPPSVADFLVCTGRLQHQCADDRAAQARALSDWVCAEMHKHSLASHRDGNCLATQATAPVRSDQQSGANDVKP